jgi:hypothetical protein
MVMVPVPYHGRFQLVPWVKAPEVRLMVLLPLQLTRPLKALVVELLELKVMVPLVTWIAVDGSVAVVEPRSPAKL